MMPTVTAPRGANPSALIAREIRAELGRQQLSHRRLAMVMDVSNMWVARRLGTGETDLTAEDIQRIADALRVPVTRLLAGWLPNGNRNPSRAEVTTTARYHGVAETLRGQGGSRDLLHKGSVSPGEDVVTPTRRPGTVPITAPAPTATIPATRVTQTVTGNYSGSAHTVPVAA